MEANWDVKYHLEGIASSAQKMLAELKAADEREKLAAAQQQLLSMGKCQIRSLYMDRVDRMTQADLDKIMESDRKVLAANAEARKHNSALLSAAIAVVEKLGFRSTTSEPVSRRSSKTHTVTAPWAAALHALLPAGESDSDVERCYREYSERIAKREATKVEKAAAEQRERERVRIEEESRKELVRMLVKRCPGGSTWTDVLNALLRASKYLRLAHYMSLNRLDWSDGPSLASEGINGFVVTTGVDENIVQEVEGLINDWDGDGRVFRDCEYNYNRLMSEEFTPAELLADYNASIKHTMEGK